MKTFFALSALSVLAVLTQSCSDGKLSNNKTDTTFTVSITVKGLDTAALLLFYEQDGNYVRDTSESFNGVFTFSGKAPEPLQASLRLRDSKNYDQLSFYLENAFIQIQASKDSLSQAIVSGSPLNAENERLQNILKTFDEKTSKLYAAYEEAGDNKMITDSLEQQMMKLNRERHKAVMNFISQNPKSFLAAYQIDQVFFYNPDVPKFDSAYNSLDSSIKKANIGKKLAERLEVVKRTDINQIAPEFALKDLAGKEIPLSFFHGKYVLIDFWASWCGPCREENPNLVKAYAAYKTKGFEILGVSIDVEKDRPKWIEAIKKDRLTWTQVVDTAGWRGDVVKTYGIVGIPMNFLLDKDGKIIAKGLRGDMLEVKLKEIL